MELIEAAVEHEEEPDEEASEVLSLLSTCAELIEVGTEGIRSLQNLSFIGWATYSPSLD